MKIVIANTNPIHSQIERDISLVYDSCIINEKEELNMNFLNGVKPDYLFFLHWSHIIPAEVYDTFTCIVFHMTDLPYGRGGSPLQNLILRGHQSTKLSALKVRKGIDTGPVYLKKDLSLAGTAEEIFLRAGKIMSEMIKEIIDKQPLPVEQVGEVVHFKRRTPAEGNLQNLDRIEDIYNYIRMLDSEGYPKAFMETELFRFEFSRVRENNNGLEADVKIIKK